MQSAIELRTLFESARFGVFDCQRTVIESGRRSVGPSRIFDFVPNSLCDRVRQSRWSRTGLDNELIDPGEEVGAVAGKIKCRERLGGMLRYYYRDAA
ncbi:MAG: hypothetical protein IH899_01235 [Planctomycetes bacterium]|nr:hypothetical protein [Planctomycetota bacterium]